MPNPNPNPNIKNIYHGVELANNSKIKNLEVEELITDPNPIRIGRIWYNTTSKQFKYTSLDNTNSIIIKAFVSFEDLIHYIKNSQIDSQNVVLANSATANNLVFSIPNNSNINVSIDLIAEEISKIKTFLNNSVSIYEFYVTNNTNLISINNLNPNKLIILINGLEQPLNCYTINLNGITFSENLLPDSYIKIINFNLI